MSAARAAFVALGSNLGDRRRTIEAAVAALAAEDARVVRVSPLVETAPVGGPAGQGPYLNGVLELSTTLEARALLARLHRLEERFGRDRASEVRNGPRVLDLDLLTFGDEEIDEHGIVVPHPRMEERIFVLEPLATLAPEQRLARSGVTVRERLDSLRRSAAGRAR